MKKRLSLVLAILLLVTLAACNGDTATPSATPTPPPPANTDSASPDAEPSAEPTPPPAAQEPSVTLVYAEVNPEDSLMGQTATAFKTEVEKLSGGSITVDIQFSGVLGKEADVLDTMLGGGGTVDMTRISSFSLNQYGAKLTSLLSIPYTFSGRAHFWKVAGSDLGAQILAEPETLNLGIRGLFFCEEGFRNFFFREEVKGIGDLAGKKIRVSDDPIMNGMVKGLKASPTVVSFTELYTSLQSGVVDGAEQPTVNYGSNSFYEVAPYMILDQHTLGCSEVLITDAAWAKLSDTQKAWVEAASKVASDFNANLSASIEDGAFADMRSKGVTFIEVTDLKAWQDACKDVISQYTAGLETEYQTIQNLA